MVSPGDHFNGGHSNYSFIKILNPHMEKTLIRSKTVTLKFIPNTVLFGISYDRPDLYIAFLCFIVEFNFSRAKKGPSTF